MTASPEKAAARACPDALDRQLDFLIEIDKLKSIDRASPIASGARPENSGEHSWHLALFAMVLADQADPEVRIDRVIRMLLIHDIVEIDAGDTPIHGDHDPADKVAREARAADRLFGLLPPAQAAAFRALWEEFEEARSHDARFAHALDRCQPPLLNLTAGGGSWADYDVTMDHIDTRVGIPASRGAPKLWARVRERISPWFTSRA